MLELEHMGDKIVIMRDGVINQIDSPLNLYNHPVNKFVAGFIGSPAMNFSEGVIYAGNGLNFRSSGGDLSIKLNGNYENALKSYVNKKVWLGIRPEDIYDLDLSKTGNMKLDVQLDIVEPLGNEIFLYFLVDNARSEEHTSELQSH